MDLAKINKSICEVKKRNIPSKVNYYFSLTIFVILINTYKSFFPSKYSLNFSLFCLAENNMADLSTIIKFVYPTFFHGCAEYAIFALLSLWKFNFMLTLSNFKMTFLRCHRQQPYWIEAPRRETSCNQVEHYVTSLGAIHKPRGQIYLVKLTPFT